MEGRSWYQTYYPVVYEQFLAVSNVLKIDIKKPPSFTRRGGKPKMAIQPKSTIAYAS